MSGVSSKRAINDTSIDENSSFEDENNKKTKMAKEIAIMILEVGSRYKDNPNQLKSDLDNMCVESLEINLI
jgi:hypothetical protein